MCLGDWKLAKQMKSSSVFVTVANSDTLIVPSSPHRVGLIFTPPGASNVRLVFDHEGQQIGAFTWIRILSRFSLP